MVRPLNILLFSFSFVLISCQKSNLSIDASQLTQRIDYNILDSGWSYSRPIRNLEDALLDIYFIDTNSGALISKGDLYRTTDGGLNWKKYENQNFNNKGFVLYNIFLNKNKDLYLVGGQKKIIKIIGDSLLETSTQNEVSDIYFINDNIGYAISGTSLLKTINAGKTWSVNKMNLFSNGKYSPNQSLFFLNNRGVVTGENKVAYSTANDTSWNISTINEAFQTNAVFMISENTYFISSNIGIYRTTNGGSSFTQVFSFSARSNYYVDLHFVNSSIGYFSYYNSIYKTSNAGNSWERIIALRERENEAIIEIHFTSESNGWACTSSGGILKYIK